MPKLTKAEKTRRSQIFSAGIKKLVGDRAFDSLQRVSAAEAEREMDICRYAESKGVFLVLSERGVVTAYTSYPWYAEGRIEFIVNLLERFPSMRDADLWLMQLDLCQDLVALAKRLGYCISPSFVVPGFDLYPCDNEIDPGALENFADDDAVADYIINIMMDRNATFYEEQPFDF